MRVTYALSILAILAGCPLCPAAEHHVAQTGMDTNAGSAALPFRTISAAAAIAQPGDVITVHEGVYRERIDPPRGGTSDDQRITYRAAPGEKVVIKGSEVVKGWERVTNDTWKVTIPNSFFGDFNPYADVIFGDWFNPKGRVHHTGAVYLKGHWLIEAASHLNEVLQPAVERLLWFGRVDGIDTTIWAQLPGVDPNAEGIEINARQTVFYPSKPFVNYITVSGFTMEHAATPWAPPSAEQKGLIGTHWSKGWIIENNVVRYSKCSGIALGKYGDETDNTNGAGAADPYTACVRRALTNGWNKATVGSHLVRNNHISHCEQTGIVGSMGCSFSTVTGNEIHDIYVHRLFAGAEMAGIKFHGAIDVEISRNHIHHVGTYGLWLDWMAQGAHVTGNLFHDNQPDLFMEVDHGPFLVDHNLFLSPRFLVSVSQGGAFAHNLIAGVPKMGRFDSRLTPYHKAHSTELAGLHNNPSGDYRFYNNLLVAAGNLSPWDDATLPVWLEGNVFTKGAVPCKQEKTPLLKPDFDPTMSLSEKGGVWTLEITLDPAWAAEQTRPLVTTEMLGRAKIPDLPFERADGTPHRFDTDFFGAARNAANPFPGPFEISSGLRHTLRVWPRSP